MRWSRSARLVLDGKEIKDGMEIPGLGKASVDVPGKLIKVDKIMRINNETIDGSHRRRAVRSRLEGDALQGVSPIDPFGFASSR